MSRLRAFLRGGAKGAMTPSIPMRVPRWSGVLTRPLARLIPASLERQALVAIKAIHTALFFSIASALALALWDGLRGTPTRRTAVAGGIVAAETAVYLSNNEVCPLTPLAEKFGAESGTVVDMFLPAAVARRIPVVAGSCALLAMVLNIGAVVRDWRIASTA